MVVVEAFIIFIFCEFFNESIRIILNSINTLWYVLNRITLTL